MAWNWSMRLQLGLLIAALPVLATVLAVPAPTMWKSIAVGGPEVTGGTR